MDRLLALGISLVFPLTDDFKCQDTDFDLALVLKADVEWG